jgi:hypothetical protein
MWKIRGMMRVTVERKRGIGGMMLMLNVMMMMMRTGWRMRMKWRMMMRNGRGWT